MHVVRRLLGVLGCATVLCACTEPAFYCTPEADTWRITVLDAHGAPVTDLQWVVVVSRTDDTLTNSSILPARSAPEAGVYAVFDDAFRHRIDAAGETIHVEGVSGLEWFAADWVFDIPDSTCSPNRVVGPDTVVIAPAEFRIANHDGVWGAGEILVTSPVLRFVADSLRFVVGADTLWSTVPAYDTVAVGAPMRSGPVLVSLLSEGEVVPLGTAQVFGYGGAATLPPVIGILAQWPAASMGQATFLAGGDGRLQLFDAVTRTVVRSFPDSIDDPSLRTQPFACIDGIGPTYDPNAFVLCPANSVYEAWSLAGPEPTLLERLCHDWTSNRMLALTAPHTWMAATKYFAGHYACPPAGVSAAAEQATGAFLLLENARHMRVSPRGDRATAGGTIAVGPGVWVLDPIGDTVAFTIEALADSVSSGVSDFTPDGAVLYAAVSRHTGTPDRQLHIVAVDATDGTVLAENTEIRLPWLDTEDLVVDPRGDWVYVVGPRLDTGLRMLVVYDPASLAVVAVLEQAPDHAAGCSEWGLVRLVLATTENAVFAVNPDEDCIERFDLLRNSGN